MTACPGKIERVYLAAHGITAAERQDACPIGAVCERAAFPEPADQVNGKKNHIPAINPNSEVSNEIEKTCRVPIMVGRVTPCAPRLQPEWTRYFSHRISNSLPVKVCFKFPRSNSGFRDKACRGLSKTEANVYAPPASPG